MAELWLFLKLLPTFIKWTQLVKKKIKAGIHEQEVMDSLLKATEAFSSEDAKQTESIVNDLWNGVHKPEDHK